MLSSLLSHMFFQEKLQQKKWWRVSLSSQAANQFTHLWLLRYLNVSKYGSPWATSLVLHIWFHPCMSQCSPTWFST
jgi:hypothetical protein